MILPSTYLEVHLVFTLPLILVLAIAAFVRDNTGWSRVSFVGLGIILILAFVYTTPWDNLLIEQGVWWYGDGVTVLHVWAAPLGEYLFFVFQPILTALWLYQFDVPTNGDLRLPWPTRVVGAIAGLAVSAVGVWFLFSLPSTLYLGAILAWAGPILAIQWAFGWPHLWRARRVVAIGIAVPTLYLWFVDRTAIALGLWTISEQYTIGLKPLGLPVEEALFFLVTNVFIVQGLVLYLWLVDQWPTVADDVDRVLPNSLSVFVPGMHPSIDRRRGVPNESAAPDRRRGDDNRP